MFPIMKINHQLFILTPENYGQNSDSYQSAWFMGALVTGLGVETVKTTAVPILITTMLLNCTISIWHFDSVLSCSSLSRIKNRLDQLSQMGPQGTL